MQITFNGAQAGKKHWDKKPRSSALSNKLKANSTTKVVSPEDSRVTMTGAAEELLSAPNTKPVPEESTSVEEDLGLPMEATHADGEISNSDLYRDEAPAITEECAVAMSDEAMADATEEVEGTPTVVPAAAELEGCADGEPDISSLNLKTKGKKKRSAADSNHQDTSQIEVIDGGKFSMLFFAGVIVLLAISFVLGYMFCDPVQQLLLKSIGGA